MIVHYYKTPIGYLKLQVSSKGVSKVEFTKEENENGRASFADKRIATEGEGPRTSEDKKEESILETCIKWLDDYFAGTMDHVQPLPPLDIQHKSEFYHVVWETLMSTHPGETLSYAELATRSGHPGKARAIGQAVSKHNLPILIPCHRVVKSGGKGIGNYSGGEGPPTKKWLLDHEKKMTAK